MELQDPKIENPTNVSNITHSTVDNEVEESRSSDMSHEVIIKTSEKPEKPKVVKCNDRDLSISWDVSSYDCEVVDFFEIQWKKKDEKRWSGRKNTDNNCNTIKLPITDLEKNTAYQFKVRWTTQEGVESQFSDISDDVLIEMSQKPGKPKGVTGNGTDLLISWDVPSIDLQAVDFFELHWKKKEEKRWSGRKTTDDNRTTMKIPITELEKNIAYQFKVRWTTQEGVESQFSDISEDIIIEMSQKPGKPKGIRSNVGDLLISWDVPSSDLQAVDFFELHWKKKEEKRWSGRKNTHDNCTTMKIPITELEKNIAYQFKVRWTTQEGVESQFSDISDDIIIEMSQKSGKPKGVTINDTDLLISWDVTSSDLQAIDFFELHWKKKEEKSWSGRKNISGNSTTMKIPITELEKNIAYQFKVRWTTQEGVESQFSDISDDIIIEMSQKPGKPKGIRSNVGDLLISWDVPSSDLQAVDFFELHWKKKEEKRWSGRKNTHDNCTTMKIPITELEKNIAYQFKVRWTTQEGVESQFSDISDDIIIEMSQKPGKPKGVTINDTDLLISWDVTSSDLQAIDFFELHWKKKEEKSWSGRKNISGNSTTMKIPITELEKNIAYQFKVRWTTQEGVESQFSDISDDIIIEMSQKPGKPKGITSNDADLLISWDVTSSNLQVVDFFELHWKKKNEKRWSGRKNTDDNCTTMKIPITELEKNIAYQFKVRWTTQEGVESQFSDISDDIIIEMSQKPGKPKGVTSKGIDLLISWDLPSSDLQVVDFFEIQWKKKDEKRWLGRRNTDDNSTSISIPITQFEKNTVYEFKVRWITKDGLESMFSEISEDIIIVMTKMPDKPNVVRRNDTDLLICWHVSSSDLQGIDYFEIQWKTKEEKRWSGLKCTDDNSTSIAIPITEFERNNTYQFKVKWITRNCEESQFSEISDDILIAAPMSTRSPQQPGKVSSSQTTANSAYLLWEKPEGPDEVSYYEVKYRSCGEVRWLRINTDQPVEKLHLKDLKGSTNYEFEVRAIFSDGNDGPYSEVSDMVTTQESLAQMLKIRATKVGYSNPQIYKIPLTFSGQTTNKNVMTRKARFGERVQLHSTKTIILVGATGAGKSTLIDAMINYIVGVSWEDDYRFTMIDMTEDEKSVANKQVFRQTNWITCYEVNYHSGSRLNYNLNIIDTPGFGDIRGIDQDKKILNQIHEFFKAPGDQGIDSIDAVCLVIQAPLVRLRPTQQYILNAILSLFGKDVTDNIFVLITFADGTEPPVIAALRNENVPFQQTFKFNNSALYKDSSDCFATMFWKLGISSFDNLFCQLSKTRTKSLWLTTEVLSQSKQIEDLSPQIRDVLRKMKTMKKEIEKEKQICVKENLKSYFRSLREQVFSMMNSVKKSLDKLAEYALKPNGFNEVNNVHLLIESEKLEARYGWEHRVQTLEEIKTGAVLVQKIRDASVQNFSTDEDLSKFLESV